MFLLVVCCGPKKTFHEQIKDDVASKFGTLPCDSVPRKSTISNIVVGEIVPIGNTGLIDVTIEFDFESAGVKAHQKDALLYSKVGESYTLEKIGGCEYSRQLFRRRGNGSGVRSQASELSTKT